MATFLYRALMQSVTAFALLMSAGLFALSAGAASAQDNPAPSAFAPQRGTRPRIVIRPPVFRNDSVGRLVVEPNVRVRSKPKPVKYDRYENTTGNTAGRAESQNRVMNLNVAGESPPASSFQEVVDQTTPSSPGTMSGPHEPSFTGYDQQTVDTLMPPAPQPVFGELVSDVPGGVVVLEGECEGGDCDATCDECHPFKQLFAFKLFKTSCDPGIGRERVRFALMEVERSEPLNSFSIRYNAFNDLRFPDRAEYFWAMQGRSPAAPESKVDYQEIIMRLEQGGGRFSMYTEIPIRVLDPVVNGNTAGLGDISFGPKMVIVDGKRWQFSHIFSTTLAAGAVSRGLSTGHTSLEPGFMLRYKWSDETYIHGDVKWRFPLAGDPFHSGDVLRWGMGVSTILYETDSFAALPTLEIVGWHVLDGLKTRPDGIVAPVDGEAFFSMYPGMRFVLGPTGDLGLFELGVGGGFTFSNNGFFETMLRLDMRFSF